MAEKIRVLSFDPINGYAGEEIENNLQGFYKCLDVNMIEIVSLDIEGTTYDIYLDEEGKINGKVPIASYDLGYDKIVGKILFTKHSDERSVSLTAKDIVAIKEYHKIEELFNLQLGVLQKILKKK